MSNIRITVACPGDLIQDANHFAMCLGEGPADAQTYGTPALQDAQGNLYAVASFMSQSMTQDPQETPQRPSWDVQPYTVNMTGAGRAQAALVIWDGTGPIPQAQPGQITVIGGMSGPEALAAMGLSVVEAPEV